MKKNAAKRRQKKITTAVVGVVAGLLAVTAIGTVLYFTVFKNVFGGKSNKIVVTDANGSEISFEPEELQAQIDVPTFYEGITINGVSVAGKTKEEVKAQFAEENSKSASDLVNVTFLVGDESIPMPTTGLTVTSDIDSIIDKAYEYGRTSTLQGNDGLKDRYNTINALKTTPVDFVSTYSLDTSAVDQLTRETLEPLQKEVVEAYASDFDLENLEFVIEESQEGNVIDIDKAIADVKTALDNKEYEVVIPVSQEIIEPTTSAEFLKEYLGLVSTTTSKTSSNDNRNTNIRLVCEKLDGLVLQPGESFNFNDYVGKRTEEAGFKMAHGIFNGDMRDELGGGICQANTMLYQSVTKADLQVDERKNHTIPSTYVDKGTDATVTWESPNFRFTNNTEYPVAIHAFYADQHVTVEIYGRPLPDGQTIELVGEFVREIAPTTVYVADATMAVGTRSTTTGSRTGYDYKSYKVWYDADGNEIKKEEYFPSHYPARNAEIHVGVLGADGKVYTMNPKTGSVDAPPEAINPTTPSDTPPADTTPGDTTPADTTPADTTPADTTPADTTPAENGG